MKISIVIPVYINNQDIYRMTVRCLQGVSRTVPEETEIIVVDDASKEGQYIDYLRRLFPNIKFVSNDINLGFAKTVNNGIRKSSGEWVLLLNNDIVIENPEWLKIMVKDAIDENVDMVSPMCGFLDPSGIYIGERNKFEKMPNGKGFCYLSGWCILVKRDVFKTIGLIPENFGKYFFEDTLFTQMALSKKFKVAVEKTNIGIKHLYHETMRAEKVNLGKEFEEKRKIFIDIMNGIIEPNCPVL